MPDRRIDLRSDTVTQPTPGMRKAMAEAPVGDDVYREDPTVNRLQERIAEMLGKEASVYVPSGTMSNLIGVRLHCQPGDEMICEADCHLYFYEQAGYAQLAGVAPRLVSGEHGVLRVEQLHDLIRPDNPHFVRTRLVCLENTHNRGGGRIQPYEQVEAICAWARKNGLRTHLDGARLLNAVVATGIEAPRWTQHFDTVSVCFSKGLGAPVGSALAGPRDLIDEGLRYRKVLGGGMRQAGIVAAGALYALQHHVDRLVDDHENARRLADGVRQTKHLKLTPDQVDTNIVIFRLDPDWGTPEQLSQTLAERGLLINATGPSTLRAVTNLNVDAPDVEQAIGILREALRSKAG